MHHAAGNTIERFRGGDERDPGRIATGAPCRSIDPRSDGNRSLHRTGHETSSRRAANMCRWRLQFAPDHEVSVSV
jgi:hypothetical protein